MAGATSPIRCSQCRSNVEVEYFVEHQLRRQSNNVSVEGPGLDKGRWRLSCQCPDPPDELADEDRVLDVVNHRRETKRYY